MNIVENFSLSIECTIERRIFILYVSQNILVFDDIKPSPLIILELHQNRFELRLHKIRDT